MLLAEGGGVSHPGLVVSPPASPTASEEQLWGTGQGRGPLREPSLDSAADMLCSTLLFLSGPRSPHL